MNEFEPTLLGIRARIAIIREELVMILSWRHNSPASRFLALRIIDRIRAVEGTRARWIRT